MRPSDSYNRSSLTATEVLFTPEFTQIHSDTLSLIARKSRDAEE